MPLTQSNDDYSMPADKALALLDVIPDYDSGDGEGPHVHTFAQYAVGMLGAHWGLPEVEAFIRKHGAESAGEQAKAMRHGLVVQGDGRTIFFATKDADE